MKEKKNKIYIYGRNPLKEVLESRPDLINKVFLTKENYNSEIGDLIKKRKIPFSFIESKKANFLVGKEKTHQGIIASLNLNKLFIDLESFIDEKKNFNKETSIVILDELQDPQNVGSIIRSAVAFGVSAVILKERKQAKIGSGAIKASSGMVFKVPLIQVVNINYTIDVLKKYGFQIIALDKRGSVSINNFKFKNPSVFIFGNEGDGVSKTTLEKSDVKIFIPISKNCESLNVSVAAGITFYKWKKDIKD